MYEASYYRNASSRDTQCFVCPHNCRIRENHRGICGVRRNIDSKLYLEVYGHPVAIHADPIEKKPLYHFHPGKNILSLGTTGCNLRCFFCQNYSISQTGLREHGNGQYYAPEDVLEIAQSTTNNLGIAYTYNEPVVFFEYMRDIAQAASGMNLKNVMVTNGFIGSDVLEEIIEFTDAFNIDLKSIRNHFYSKHTGSFISPVLDSLKKVSLSGSHLEVTHLIIPGLNDDEKDFRDLIHWMNDNLEADTVLHLSRYHPAFKAKMESTPPSLLTGFFEMASEFFPYVYLGNFWSHTGNNTNCPGCKREVIIRNGFSGVRDLTHSGECPDCGMKILKHY